jgi:DNA uptake protein ComE-like DNA-binding protein
MILCTGFLMTGLMLSNATAQPCVNIDKASAKELLKLKGVGEKTANNVIKYRKNMRKKSTMEKKKTWNFNNWKTLLKVKGMNLKVCNDNLKKVCFSDKKVPQKTCPKIKKTTKAKK